MISVLDVWVFPFLGGKTKLRQMSLLRVFLRKSRSYWREGGARLGKIGKYCPPVSAEGGEISLKLTVMSRFLTLISTTVFFSRGNKCENWAILPSPPGRRRWTIFADFP